MTGRDVLWRFVCEVKLFMTEYLMETSETVSGVKFSYDVSSLSLTKDVDRINNIQ